MSALLRFYRYVFYWGYSWSLRTYGPAHNPEMTGLGAIAFGVYLNLFAGALLLEWLTTLPVIPLGLPKWEVGLAAMAILSPQYLFLVHNGRYRRIAATFDRWPAERRRHLNRWVGLYLAGSLALWLLVMYVGKNFPNPLHLG